MCFIEFASPLWAPLPKILFLSAGTVRKSGRNQITLAHTRVARSISIKDVIAVLEREPQMSRSSLIYRLYERVHSDATTE